jgi:CrcB protein
VETWYQVAVLSLGGVLGVNARYWLGVVINRWVGSQFPWATFTINVTGSFAIGLCTVVLARWLPHPHARLLVVVGFLGGYTTFSSYSLESLALWERGERGLCLTYMVGSVVAGFVAVVLGTAVGQGLMPSGASRATAGGRASPGENVRAQPSSLGGRATPPALADDPLLSARRPVYEPEEPEASS